MRLHGTIFQKIIILKIKYVLAEVDSVDACEISGSYGSKYED
jgi:hypothetical protein